MRLMMKVQVSVYILCLLCTMASLQVTPTGPKLDPVTSLYCGGCSTAVDTIIMKRKVFNFNENTILSIIKQLCKPFGVIYDSEVCINVLKDNIESVLYIVDEVPGITGSKACAIVLQNYNCPGELPPKWAVNIRKGVRTPKKIGNPKATPLSVLHLTDVHYDPDYSAATTAICKKPLCCQRDDNKAKHSSDRPGYWTDYRNCDCPERFITNAFKRISTEHKFDYIYFTGDIISHRMWDTSIRKNSRDIEWFMSELRKAFLSTPLFPVMGNHEPHPLNLFPPESLKDTKLSNQWLFDLVAELWEQFLPEGTDLSTVRRGGFYTAKTAQGLRIVALNDNVAYTFNYWLLYDDKDPYDQLQWLSDVLHEAEEAEEIVHILMHMPSGDSMTYSPWAEEFNRIVKRYSNIITGIFYGHTHYDELSVFYDGNAPITVGYSGGSLTPFTDVNPNYRIYSLDPENFDILDFDEYIVDLTESNRLEEPRWFKLYSFREEYGLTSMSPVAINDLVHRMATNHTLREIYQKNKVRNAAPSMQKGCDTDCHKLNLCNMVTTVYNNRAMCDIIMNKYNSS